MADLTIRINSGTTPIIVELGEYIGSVWVPRPGNHWEFYSLDTYTVNDLVPGLVILRAWERDNPLCFVQFVVILYDENTTTTSEEPAITTTSSEIPIVTTTSEEPSVTTTSSEEPAITTTSSEEEITTTTSV